MSHVVGHPGARDARGSPQRDLQIGSPGLPAELAPLDLYRLLPAEILRLLVRQNFLRVCLGFDDL
jgi:hypothetical protein